MFDVRACRGCLNTECKLEKISDAFRRILPSLTGLEVSEADGYPQYLCVECHAQVRKALAFRRKCRRAGYVMKQIMTAKKQVCFSDIMAVNRIKTNLTSSIKITKCKTEVEIVPEEILEQERERERMLEEQKKIQEEECNLLEVDAEVDREDTFVDNEDEFQNIDLDDVFKDLKEESEKEDTELESEKEDTVKVEPPEKKKKIPVKTKKKIYKNNFTHKALENSVIKYVPVEKQRANFQMSLLCEPFKSAMYKCSICVMVFAALKDLVAHVQKHQIIINGHCCDICKWSFSTEEELTVHQSTHHWYEYECSMCNGTHYTLFEQGKCYEVNEMKKPSGKPKRAYLSEFIRKPLAQEAMPVTLINSVESGPKCTICNMGFGSNTYNFKSHIARHLAAEYKCTCDICGCHFRGKQSLTVHMQLYHMYTYTCKHCNELLTNSALAWHHLKNNCTVADESKTADQSPFKCKLCGKTFSYSKVLANHMNFQHYCELFVHHCIICGVAFKSMPELLQHQINEHNYIRISDRSLGSEQFSCATCSLRLLNQRALETHLVKFAHQGAHDVPLACLPCKLVFGSQEDCESHAAECKKTKATNRYEYPQKCLYCEQIMHTYPGYLSHYRWKHKDQPAIPGLPVEAPVQHTNKHTLRICELCGKQFKRGQLRKHRLRHLMEDGSTPKPTMSCHLCEVKAGAFVNLAQYVVHLINHTSKPYCCALCPARFKYRCDCRDHILKTHAPVRPFKCGVCARTFSHVDYMHEHMVKAHGAAPKKAAKKKFNKGKLIVYPHMKLDVSGIDTNLLKQVSIYLHDYTGNCLEVLKDYSDHITFEPCNENETARRVITRDDEPKRRRKKVKNKLKDSIKSGENVIIEEHYAEEYMNDESGTYKFDDEVSDVVADNVDMTKVLDESGREHDIILHDGVQHVLIDGILYKLEYEP